MSPDLFPNPVLFSWSLLSGACSHSVHQCSHLFLNFLNTHFRLLQEDSNLSKERQEGTSSVLELILDTSTACFSYMCVYIYKVNYCHCHMSTSDEISWASQLAHPQTSAQHCLKIRWVSTSGWFPSLWECSILPQIYLICQDISVYRAHFKHNVFQTQTFRKSFQAPTNNVEWQYNFI